MTQATTETLTLNPITIKGRTFEVTAQDHPTGRLYLIKGKGGAEYGCIRRRHDGLIAIIRLDFRAANVAPFPGVFLTDASGQLEVAR